MDARYGVSKDHSGVYILIVLFAAAFIFMGMAIYIEFSTDKECKELGFESGIYERGGICLTGERFWIPMIRDWHNVNCPIEIARQNNCEEILNDQTNTIRD